MIDKVTFAVIRHELPSDVRQFTIMAYGFQHISIQMENGLPVMYEIGITSEDDSDAYPHHYIWWETWEPLPEGLRQDTFIGTFQFSDGQVRHLFREWRS